MKKMQAKKAIEKSMVLDKLIEYSPTVVSTILVGFDTQDSDIDIICTYIDQKRYIEHIKNNFSQNNAFAFLKKDDFVLFQFAFDGFLLEVYGEQNPIQKQNAYRHFKIMERISKIGGDNVQKIIRELKQNDVKTEAAIAAIFQLSGNPFEAVLEIENWSDAKISEACNDLRN
ncbi:MAG: DUF4269 domain-containing protein [Waterburya sp.]